MSFLEKFTNADGELLIRIQAALVHDGLTPVAKAISFLGNAGWFFIVIVVLLLCVKKTRRLGMLAAISLILCFFMCNVWLKPMVDRTRPWVLFEGVNRLIPPPGDPSFPSGHSANSMAVAFAVFLNSTNKKYGAALVALSVLIGITRLYLGVHFPSDVAAGLLLGMLCAFAVYAVDKYYRKKRGMGASL